MSLDCIISQQVGGLIPNMFTMLFKLFGMLAQRVACPVIFRIFPFPLGYGLWS